MNTPLLKNITISLSVSLILGVFLDIFFRLGFFLAIPFSVFIFLLYVYKTNVKKTLRFFVMSAGSLFVLIFLVTVLFNIYFNGIGSDMFGLFLIMGIPVAYAVGLIWGVFLYKIYRLYPSDYIGGMDIENNTTKIIAFIILILVSTISFLESSLRNLKANYNGFGIRTFSSMGECDDLLKSRYYETAGECYGYFAGQKNNMGYCDSANNAKDMSFVKTVSYECMKNYAIQRNDINDCQYIKDDNYKQQCIADYYIAKVDNSGCKKIKDEYYKKECATKTKMYFSLARWYAQIRGEDFK